MKKIFPIYFYMLEIGDVFSENSTCDPNCTKVGDEEGQYDSNWFKHVNPKQIVFASIGIVLHRLNDKNKGFC